jgi:hypothetical protein
MNSILEPEESAAQALLDHIEDLSGADPRLVAQLYEFAGLGSKTDPFASQVNALQAFVESKASEVRKELKGKTVEEALESFTGGARNNRRSRSRRTTRKSRSKRRRTIRQRGGLGFLGRLFIGLLVVMSKIGMPGGEAAQMRKLRPAWNDPSPVKNGNFKIKVAQGWMPKAGTWAPHPKEPPAPEEKNRVNLNSLSALAKARVQEFREKVRDFQEHGESNEALPGVDVCARNSVECGDYPRYVMPQIDDLDSFLEDADGLGIHLTYTNETRTLDQIQPSQSEALQSRVDSTAADIVSGKLDLNESPIIISEKGDIIDGHHRYFALDQLKRTDVPIPVRVIDAPTVAILEAAAAVGLPHAPQVGWSGLNPGGI